MEHGVVGRHAPVDVVVRAHPIAGTLALVVVALAFATGALAAAVVVRDEVVAAIGRVLAGAGPADLGSLGARRALRGAAAAAAAQEAVEGAVAPVLALRRVLGLV